MRRISVENVGKKFHPRSNEQAITLRENFLNGFRRARRPDPTWALRDVSFEVSSGEAVGIVGANGSGKTTLLRLLGGIYAPDEGNVKSQGRVHGVLELNTGMHPDLTGRENAILASILSGCLRQEAEDRLESIIEFSEIRHAIDKPFRTYSSGMKLRLGFAVAVHVEPDIFLIDEVIAVGDLGFQYKCIERIREVREKGASIIMVSHDLEQLSQLCDRAVWIDNGHVTQIGEAGEVISQFCDMLYAPHSQEGSEEEPDETGVQLVSVKAFDHKGRQTTFLETGAPITIEIKLQCPEPIPRMIVDFSLYSKAGDLLISRNTEADCVEVSSNTTEIRLALDRLDLAQGAYLVSVGVYGDAWSPVYAYRYEAVELNVVGVGSKAPIAPPCKWSVKES